MAHSEPVPIGCRMTHVPVKVFERPNSDAYLSPKIEGGKTIVVFNTSPQLDVLRGRAIVDEEPENAVARLSDGSGLAFDRDCRGVKCVYLGLKTTPNATDCWAWLSVENQWRSRNAAGDFVLSDRASIAVENTRSSGRLILRIGNGDWQTTDEPLIVTARAILGFGVSVPSIHGGIRNIDVVKRERDGSLSLAHYIFVNR